jgi:hypothetical protein
MDHKFLEEVKTITVHAMRAYMEEVCVAPPIPNLSTRHLASNEQETGKSVEPVWTFWRKEKSLAPAKNHISDCPAHIIITILSYPGSPHYVKSLVKAKLLQKITTILQVLHGLVTSGEGFAVVIF